MASYTEIAGLFSPDDTTGVREKVVVATFVRADAVRQLADDNTATTRQLKRFAQRVFKILPSAAFAGRADSGYAGTEIEAIYRAVLIAKKDATLAQTQAVTDAQIQTAVNAAFDFLATSFPDPDPAP